MDLLKKYLLPTSLFLLVVALLVGNRLGFVFAGGTGFQRPLFFVSDEQSYPRGSTIETNVGERRLISNDWLSLWLDENTTLRVDVLTDDSVELTLTRGRIVANDIHPSNRMTIITASETHTRLTIDQPISIVNYDFLGKVDVFLIGETQSVNGAAQEFYQWYFLQTNFDNALFSS